MYLTKEAKKEFDEIPELRKRIKKLEEELIETKKDNEQYRQMLKSLEESDNITLPDFSETVKKLFTM